MDLEIREESMESLAGHAEIPIAFRVERVLHVEIPEAGTPVLRERTVERPWTKDYDAEEDPLAWPTGFDLSNWRILAAYADGRRVGGAVLAFRTEGIEMLEGRADLVVVWDIRVAPEVRGEGVGRALWTAAERWAAARGCRQLKVETQNVNVPACRFYAAMGCELRSAHSGAYAELPDEVMLLWTKDLENDDETGG